MFLRESARCAQASARRVPECLTGRGIRAGLASGAVALFWALAPAQASALPQPTHSYEFSGDLKDDLGGPSMVIAPGANNSFVGAGASAGMRFAALQGPNVTGAFANPGVYSMEVEFYLDDLDNFRRLIDFKDGITDLGLYYNAGDLEFYGVSPHVNVGAKPGALTHLVVTRDASANLKVFHNGQLALSFLDDGEDGVLSQPGGIVRFFDDDGAEGAAGFVDFIRTYDAALTAADVTALYNNGDPLRFAAPVSGVPEPTTWAMMILGLGATGAMLRRRVSRGLPGAA